MTRTLQRQRGPISGVVLASIMCAAMIVNQVVTMPVAEKVEHDSISSDPAWAIGYMKQFGYINELSNKSDDHYVADGLKKLQAFSGLQETGSLTDETADVIKQARCGSKDIQNFEIWRRADKWSTDRPVTYKISSYPPTYKGGPAKVRQEIRSALRAYEKVSSLRFKFVQPSESSDIEIQFVKRAHSALKGACQAGEFDGPGGTLAHAFFPRNGQIHFDIEENWNQVDNMLQKVALHQIGHAVGLSHIAKEKLAIMSPFYSPKTPAQLHPLDIKAVQELYPLKAGQDPPSTTPKPDERPGGGSGTGGSGDDRPDRSPRPDGGSRPDGSPRPDGNDNDGEDEREGESEVPSLCEGSGIDAFVSGANGKKYIFRHEHYWPVGQNDMVGEPRKIADDWPGLPDNFDAGFSTQKGKIYFFKADKYWRFSDMRYEDGPLDISSDFPGIPNYIEAAFEWSFNKKLYFFKGDQYWRFDMDSTPPFTDKYPRHIKYWKGLKAANIDSVIQASSGKTYFFQGDEFWRIDRRGFVDRNVNQPYPHSFRNEWLECNSNLAPLSTNPQNSTTTVQRIVNQLAVEDDFKAPEQVIDSAEIP